MSIQVASLLEEEEPPLTRTQQAVAKACRYLLYLLCVAPIALFPVGVAYKAFIHFFP